MIPSPMDRPSDEVLAAKSATARWMLVEPDHAALEGIAKMLQEEQLKVLVADSKPLAEMAALHALSEFGSTTGKLVATVPQD